MLDVLDELDVKEEENLSDFSSGIQLVGTKIGQDTETQITTIIQGDQLKFTFSKSMSSSEKSMFSSSSNISSSDKKSISKSVNSK